MRTVVLRDRLLLSPFALGAAAEEAARRGFSVWEFFDPLVPARLTGLAVPEAGVCFAPERLTGPGEAVLDTDTALSPSAREALDARADVLAAVVRALTDEAVSRLDACLAVHDRLEAVYRPYTDFAALDALSGELIGALTGL